MSGLVIDIATGRDIAESGINDNAEETPRHCKPLLEISDPDGRTVFSIGRLLDESQGEDSATGIP